MEFVVRWRNLWESFLQLSLRFYLVIIFSFKPIFQFARANSYRQVCTPRHTVGRWHMFLFYIFVYVCYCVKDRAEEIIEKYFRCSTHSIHLFGWEKSGMISSFDTRFWRLLPIHTSRDIAAAAAERRQRTHTHNHTVPRPTWMRAGPLVQCQCVCANCQKCVPNCRKYRKRREKKTNIVAAGEIS